MENYRPAMSFDADAASVYDAVSRRGDEEETVEFLHRLADGGRTLELAFAYYESPNPDAGPPLVYLVFLWFGTQEMGGMMLVLMLWSDRARALEAVWPEPEAAVELVAELSCPDVSREPFAAPEEVPPAPATAALGLPAFGGNEGDEDE